MNPFFFFRGCLRKAGHPWGVPGASNTRWGWPKRLAGGVARGTDALRGGLREQPPPVPVQRPGGVLLVLRTTANEFPMQPAATTTSPTGSRLAGHMTEFTPLLSHFGKNFHFRCQESALGGL